MYDPASKMFLPPNWGEITPEDRLAAYNGVGPDFLPEWLQRVLDTIYWWASDPVSVHDVEYTYGSSRIMADLRMLANCLLNSKGNPRRVVMSFVAYISLVLFGRRAWREGHKICR
jgi:hypothetical protein